MRALIVLLLICSLTLPLSAEVVPVVLDEPLALRDINLNNENSVSRQQERYLDDWLNFRINSDNSGQVQNEQQIVINPTNPDNIVAVWRDFRLGYRRVGLGRSFDGGFTWEDELFVDPFYDRQSDPGLTWHSSGRIYSVILSYDFQVINDALRVASSDDGGITWSDWYTAVANNTEEIFEDKELMACDRSGSVYDGNVYVVWTRFGAQTQIMCVRSVDGGINWNDPVQVSNNSSVQWPVPGIGPNSEVYVGWCKYGNPDAIRLNRSYDGGLTFGDEDLIVQYTSFTSANIYPDLLIFSFPAMDVDITNGPHRGQIYIAYTDDWYGDADLFFTTSTDSGSTWSIPTRINDDLPGNGADQFHPWMVCDENGVLHLIFYDRRDDLPRNLFMHLYYTYSIDSGHNWSPNERITTVASNPGLDSLDSGLIGEYNGLAVLNNVIHPIWTDTREGQQDSYTAVMDTTTSVSPRENPFDVVPSLFAVSASPNPFNGSATLEFTIPADTQTRLSIFDVQGREVALLADKRFQAGKHRIDWLPEDLPSGLYFVVIKTESDAGIQKLVYLK